MTLAARSFSPLLPTFLATKRLSTKETTVLVASFERSLLSAVLLQYVSYCSFLWILSHLIYKRIWFRFIQFLQAFKNAENFNRTSLRVKMFLPILLI